MRRSLFPGPWRATAAYCLALTLISCAPKAELAVAPEILSTEWQSTSSQALSSPVSQQSLGETFDSAELIALIAQALSANADIAVASARIQAARAELKIARAQMLPVVAGSAGVNLTETEDKDASLYSFSEGFAGLDIAWDLDLFGGARAGKRAAGDRVAAAMFDRDAVALAVEAEVTRIYVQHAALSDRIRLLERNIDNARDLERILGVRYREGAATRVDTGLQSIDVRQLEGDRLRLLESRSRTQNALALLVGEEAPLFRLQAGSLGGMRMTSIAPVQPGELLVRRPDIRAAEARIAASSGDVAQARAAFLPNLRLSASALGQAATLGGPIGTTLVTGASLLGPIFDRGRLNGRLSAASAAQRESVELYRKGILTALVETENALTAVEKAHAHYALIGQVLEEARLTAHLARRQFLEGEADLRTVLDADRLLVQSEDARAVAIQEILTATADLYQALGGNPRSA